VSQGSVFSPTLYSLCINDALQTPNVHVALYADGTCIYCTDRKESYVLRKLQHGLTLVESWCEHWNIKITEDKTQAIYFSHRLRLVLAHCTLNRWNTPFVNQVRYINVIFDRNITWRIHIQMIEIKVFRIFVRVYFLFRSEWLSAIIKLTLHKALIRSIMTYACPAWVSVEFEIAMPRKQSSSRQWQVSKVRTGPRVACCFHNSVRGWFYHKLCRQQAEVIQNNHNLYMFITYDKAKSSTGNIKGLTLAAVKLTTIQVITKCKIRHICCTKPGVTERSCIYCRYCKYLNCRLVFCNV
jgi:hypothetical protein